MVEFHVDRGSGLPAYLQLSRQVREALRLGWLQPGDRLPTVRDVVASSGVNANTVLKAYRELELAGLVEARQGSGTFVKASLGSAAGKLAFVHPVPVFTISVVLIPFFRITEHFICLVELLEFFFSFFIALVFVGMKLYRKLPECFLDLIPGCSF